MLVYQRLNSLLLHDFTKNSEELLTLRIHVTGIFTYMKTIDINYKFYVGKYTVRPMDP